MRTKNSSAYAEGGLMQIYAYFSTILTHFILLYLFIFIPFWAKEIKNTPPAIVPIVHLGNKIQYTQW